MFIAQTRSSTTTVMNFKKDNIIEVPDLFYFDFIIYLKSTLKHI